MLMMSEISGVGLRHPVCEPDIAHLCGWGGDPAPHVKALLLETSFIPYR